MAKKRGSAGGLAVKAKYGIGHLVNLGKRGFQKTTDLYFGGNRKAHLEWLRRKGAFTIDSQASYANPFAFPDPGPHPAHLTPEQQEYQELVAWLEDAEAGMGEA